MKEGTPKFRTNKGDSMIKKVWLIFMLSVVGGLTVLTIASADSNRAGVDFNSKADDSSILLARRESRSDRKIDRRVDRTMDRKTERRDEKRDPRLKARENATDRKIDRRTNRMEDRKSERRDDLRKDRTDQTSKGANGGGLKDRTLSEEDKQERKALYQENKGERHELYQENSGERKALSQEHKADRGNIVQEYDADGNGKLNADELKNASGDIKAMVADNKGEWHDLYEENSAERHDLFRENEGQRQDWREGLREEDNAPPVEPAPLPEPEVPTTPQP
jgi:hypothetical protein